MVVEDEIRAKGLGVVLDGSILHTRETEIRPNSEESPTSDDGAVEYFRARYLCSRDGLRFSIVLNVILALWIAGLMWRW